jgi:hypothetical protein
MPLMGYDEPFAVALRLRLRASQKLAYDDAVKRDSAPSLSDWVRDRLDEASTSRYRALLDPDSRRALDRAVELLRPLRSSPEQILQIALERLVEGLEREGVSFLAGDTVRSPGKAARKR